LVTTIFLAYWLQSAGFAANAGCGTHYRFFNEQNLQTAEYQCTYNEYERVSSSSQRAAWFPQR